MKISYLIWSLGNTGGMIVLYNFMDNLVKRGHEVYAILPDRNIKWEVGKWKEEMKKEKPETNKTKIIKFLTSKIFKHFKLDKKIMKYSKNYALKRNINGLIKNWVVSDITISTYCLTTFAGYLLSDRTISLYHMQGYEELFFQDRVDRLIAKSSYYLPLIKIANSKWLQNIISKRFGFESSLLNPGIDLSTFKPMVSPKKKYYEKNHWTIVSYMDEKSKLKGFNDCFKIIKRAREFLEPKGITLTWKVFGYSKPSLKYETELEYVGKLFGEDLARLYSEADFVLLTSWYESFPLPPIEAMACGSLIITTRYGTEDYVHDGINGLVCLPRKIEEMSNKIIFAIENPKKCLQMVKNGLNTVKQYDWEKNTLILEKILEESINSYSLNDFELIDDIVDGNYHEQITKLLQVQE